MTPQQVTSFLSLLVLLSNIFLVAVAALSILKRYGLFKRLWTKVVKYLHPRALPLAFLVALSATSGSLYFSEVAKYDPCKFCWLQRIFMYPLVVILGTALVKRGKEAFDYVLPLALIGLVLAGYHYKIQLNPESLVPCSTVGFSASCSKKFFTHYGYITIPWMSFSGFALITFFSLLGKFGVVKK